MHRAVSAQTKKTTGINCNASFHFPNAQQMQVLLFCGDDGVDDLRYNLMYLAVGVQPEPGIGWCLPGEVHELLRTGSLCQDELFSGARC